MVPPLCTTLLLVCTTSAIAQPHALFVRGADRSGGFLESTNDTDRTEQLADITNTSTDPGNHGWFELAQSLRDDGFLVTQMIEQLELHAPVQGPTQGAPIRFEQLDLSVYDVIVMGSNNAVYPDAAIDAIEQYILEGGGALFISDAGFGSNWADASNSDQQFLDRFGWVMQQDIDSYRLSREDDDFLAPQHPVLLGVNEIEGEGISPGVWSGVDVANVSSTPLVRAAPGAITRNNDAVPGSVRPTAPTDAASITALAGCGRIAIHCDRNTFFNLNGAGTDLHKLDHRVYARNLLRWLSRGGTDADHDGDSDFDDLLLFLQAFIAGDPSADLVAPFGEHDFADVLEFLNIFVQACP